MQNMTLKQDDQCYSFQLLVLLMLWLIGGWNTGMFFSMRAASSLYYHLSFEARNVLFVQAELVRGLYRRHASLKMLMTRNLQREMLDVFIFCSSFRAII